jgi:ubiquinone/menaquinone biosynthesis C-methylase UbiE
MKNTFLPAAHWSFLTRYYEVLSRPFAHRIWKRIADEVARRAPHTAKIIDLGCGPGTVLRLIAMRRPDLQLYGIDIDPEIVSIARKKDTHQSTIYEVASITNLPIADASVDIAVSSLMFHHLDTDTQRSALCEVRRILKPSGVFLLCDISVPRRKWIAPIAAFLYSFEPTAPLQIREQLFTLAAEYSATIDNIWSAFGCISLHVITFPKTS